MQKKYFAIKILLDIIMVMKNKLSIQIKKSKRKTISIQILNSKDILVKAPLKCKNENIWQFINCKSKWIDKQINKMYDKQQFENNFDFTKHIYILGKSYMKPINFSYIQTAEEQLPKIVDIISNKLGYTYNILKLKHSKRLWGSFSNSQQLVLNINCIVLPLNLIEYVIVHELCHSKEMNHSPKFWHLVEKHLPDYKSRKEQLKDYSFLLNKKL